MRLVPIEPDNAVLWRGKGAETGDKDVLAIGQSVTVPSAGVKFGRFNATGHPLLNISREQLFVTAHEAGSSASIKQSSTNK